MSQRIGGHFLHAAKRFVASSSGAATRTGSTAFRSLLVSASDDPARLTQCLAYRLTPEDLPAADTSLMNAETLGRIVSLHCANQSEINRFNLQQVIERFARGPNDTGSPEVQVALTTVRLMYVGEHCQSHRHDHKSQRHLVELAHQRKRMLKYLKQVSLERFYTMLDAIGLPPNYLETFSNPYNYRYERRDAKGRQKRKGYTALASTTRARSERGGGE